MQYNYQIASSIQIFLSIHTIQAISRKNSGCLEAMAENYKNHNAGSNFNLHDNYN